MDSAIYWSAMFILGWFVAAITAVYRLLPTPPRKFPKGHIREYDPTGQYVYKDQNSLYKEIR